MSVYDSCVALSGGNDTAALQCIATSMDDRISAVTADYNSVSANMNTIALDLASLSMGVDIFFLIFAATVMFFMQAGFAMLCAGSVQAKNVQNTIMKNLLDACGSGLAFFAVGYAFAYGGTPQDSLDVYTHEPVDVPITFIGYENFFLIGVENYAFWMYQYAFAATAATIVAGTLAERCQMTAYLLYSSFLTSFVYPIIAHAVWSANGFLTTVRVNPLFGVGMIDFAGSGVVHVTGGFTALIASKILGPRKGRFDEEQGIGMARRIEGNSSSLKALGCLILWFGWYGFNCGSIHQVSTATLAKIASLSAVSTTLGAAAGAITALALSAQLARRQTGELSYDLSDALNGCLAGLVSITAGCGMIEPWAAALIGAIGGIVYLISGSLLVKFRIDDAVEAIPVHLGPGIWGVLSVGLFASPRRLMEIYGHTNHPGWFYSFTHGGSDARLLAANIVGLLFIIAWVLATMLPFFHILSYLGWFRTDSLEEIIGLDPGTHQERDNITRQHMAVLRKRLNAREGIPNEHESLRPIESDEFVHDP
ncbi:hypothetical protein ACHAWF_011048 [Thalassiosira exigua]